MTKYTKEEIEIAIRLDDDAHPIAETLRWAAGQYLKALTVIEWYSDEKIYSTTPIREVEIEFDRGQLARNFLNDSL